MVKKIKLDEQGQSIKITPLQCLTVHCAAHSGFYLKPKCHIICSMALQSCCDWLPSSTLSNLCLKRGCHT